MTLSLLDLQFLGLLTAVACLRGIVPLRLKGYVGPVASAVLIGMASMPTLLLIGGIAVFYLYPLCLLIKRAKAAGGQKAAKPWLIGGVLGLLALLVAYRFTRDFQIPLLVGSVIGRTLLEVVGLSYFFFKGVYLLYLHYLIDIEERNPIAMLYYALFPPTLTSGPIQKYNDFREQLDSPQPLNVSNLKDAVYRITRGFFWKLCLVHLLQQFLDHLLAGEAMAYTSILILFTMYALIYFDFAGYAEIAIGFGLLLGIRVPENFRHPYKATSITEFWRNWHITLVDSLRDLVFIPAGGMRRGGLYASALAFVMLVLVGLWHGLTPIFLAWGTYHGLLLFWEGVTGSRPMPPAKRHGLPYWRRLAWTNFRVALSCAFFLPSAEATSTVLEGFTRWL